MIAGTFLLLYPYSFGGTFGFVKSLVSGRSHYPCFICRKRRRRSSSPLALDTGEQVLGLGAPQYRCLALLDDMLWPLDRSCGVAGNDLLDEMCGLLDILDA